MSTNEIAQARDAALLALVIAASSYAVTDEIVARTLGNLPASTKDVRRRMGAIREELEHQIRQDMLVRIRAAGGVS